MLLIKFDAMKEQDKENLIKESQNALAKSYSPYSNNKVGAALLAGIGRIYLGANIGNACSTLNCCAEQVALSSAVMNNDLEFVAIAVVQASGDPCLPCGRCLQLLSEFADDMLILFTNGTKITEYSLKYLLPLPCRRSEQGS